MRTKEYHTNNQAKIYQQQRDRIYREGEDNIIKINRNFVSYPQHENAIKMKDIVQAMPKLIIEKNIRYEYFRLNTNENSEQAK